MTRPFIHWQDVRKAFGPQEVLRGFSLSIRRGESIAILGGSGSGKSVALRHVVGLVSADSGKVLVDGLDVTALSDDEMRPIRRGVGMVFQGGALFDSMSVAENVAYSLEEHDSDMPEGERLARVEECLELVQLPGIGETMPSSLSGGMKKRVALARVWCPHPHRGAAADDRACR